VPAHIGSGGEEYTQIAAQILRSLIYKSANRMYVRKEREKTSDYILAALFFWNNPIFFIYINKLNSLKLCCKSLLSTVVKPVRNMEQLPSVQPRADCSQSAQARPTDLSTDTPIYPQASCALWPIFRTPPRGL